MATELKVFARQTWALTRKTLRIAVFRHWFSTALRALILPIAFLVLLLEIKHLIIEDNGYGVGSPSPVQSLENALPNNEKLVFVQPPGLGPDVQEVVTKITSTLTPAKHVVFLTDVNDLLTTCRQNLDGSSDCFAAVVFDDSPLTTGPSSKATWTYTIRADNQYNGFKFHVGQNNNNEDVIYLPLQVALEDAMTNSTIIPNHYMYTSITQAEADKNAREQYQRLVISTYGIAFFVSMVSPIYHSVSMITSERESGMTQLIDAMGGSPAARILAYVLAFDIIYTPCWIIFGFCKYFSLPVPQYS
jgi:ATP-binding cassette, subfamily A (ABC1), member 3